MSRSLKKKTILLVIVEIIFLLVLAFALISMQTRIALESKEQEVQSVISSLPELKAEAELKAESEEADFDEHMSELTSTLAWVYSEKIESLTDALTLRTLSALSDEIRNIIILKNDGTIKAKAFDTPADFSFDRFNALKAVTSTHKVNEAFEIDFDSETTIRYYAAPIDRDTLVVVEADPSYMKQRVAQVSGWDAIASHLSVSDEGFIAVIDSRTDQFIYYPDSSLIGDNALAYGIDSEYIKDGFGTWLTLNGERVYAEFTRIGDEYVITAIPESEIISSRNMTVAVILAIFFIVTVLMISYAVFVLEEQEDSPDTIGSNYKKIGALYYNITVSRKIMAIALVGTVLIFLGSLYMQNLFSISMQAVINNGEAQAAQTSIAAGEDQAEFIEEQYKIRYLEKSAIIASILSEDEDYATRKDLKTLSSLMGLKYIYRVGADGLAIATDSPDADYNVSLDTSAAGDIMRILMKGVEEYISDPVVDEAGHSILISGTAMYDADGIWDGFLAIEVDASELSAALDASDITYVMSRMKTANDGIVFAIDKESGTVVYYPRAANIGKLYSDLGIPESALAGDLTGYITLDSSRYYVSSVETGDYYIYAGTPEERIGDRNVAAALILTLLAFICMAIICLLLPLERAIPERAEEEDESHARFIEVKGGDGRSRRTETVLSRWSNTAFSWDELSSGQRFTLLLKVMMGIFAVVICVLIAFKDRLLSEHSVFVYVLEGNWERGVNIFSLTGCFLYICIIATVSIVLKALLSAISRTFDTAVETVCRLLSSLVKYVSVIVALYMCFALFGVDTTTLLASAGILSLVIGLGAQSLVSDIIAGLFIIFEGEFRVGDVVTIGGDRGTVMEISVRTTKIKEAGDNVRVISNSSIGNVLNMTKANSVATCDYAIEYGESLERVEYVLSKELPHLKERLPAIVDGPYYKGVSELGDNSVNIRILAYCKEGDRFQLVRDMNREFKLMFDKYNINIPFPQVVVNQPVTFEDATRWQKERADEFAKEQSRLISERGGSAEEGGA